MVKSFVSRRISVTSSSQLARLHVRSARDDRAYGQPVMTPSRRERIVLSIFAASLICVFGFHFACTLLYLTPPNPIRIALHAPLERYMNPHFSQSWRLFAPEPGGTDAVVWVACRFHESESPQESEWFDITTPLHEYRYAHRFSPGLLLARAQKPRLFMLADPMHDAIRRYGLPNAVIDAARAELEATSKRRFEAGQAHLYRIASAACDRRFGVGRTAYVKARYLSRKVPAFGDRDSSASSDATNELRTYDFAWAPYEPVDGY
jgi:Family of unknown function (DUF5819)